MTPVPKCTKFPAGKLGGIWHFRWRPFLSAGQIWCRTRFTRWPGKQQKWPVHPLQRNKWF